VHTTPIEVLSMPHTGDDYFVFISKSFSEATKFLQKSSESYNITIVVVSLVKLDT